MPKGKMVVVENEEKISSLIKDIDFKNVFKKNSKYKDKYELILACVFKCNDIKYKCYGKKCSTKNSEKRDLLINYKNGKSFDLRIENIELLCPNCYFDLHGSIIFKKMIEKKKIKCLYCGYENVHLLSEFYQKEKTCKVCYETYTKSKKRNNIFNKLLLEDEDDFKEQDMDNFLNNYSNTNVFIDNENLPSYTQNTIKSHESLPRKKIKTKSNKSNLKLNLSIDFEKTIKDIENISIDTGNNNKSNNKSNNETDNESRKH